MIPGGARFMGYYQRLFPPPIPSAYTTNPLFEKEFRQALTISVRLCNPNVAIEFGCAFGFSTAIIAKAMPLESKLYVFDLFDRADEVEVARNMIRVGAPTSMTVFRKQNIWYWILDPEPWFDFLYVDCSICETLIETLYKKFEDRIREGVVILFEGPNRLKLKVPYKLLVARGGGLGMLLP